ncbi:hypothetical protein OIU78_025838 [Salix suchowensis]|nr:hypothetical protein OIU78_025838 [Salix suchowensis]
MARCFSFTAYPERIHRYSFSKAGPLSLSSNLGDGKIIHCWVPRISKPSNPVFCFSMALDPMQSGVMAWKNQIFPGSMRYEARLMEAVHDEAATILLPQTPEKSMELIRLSLVNLAKGVPPFFLTDVIDVRVNI